MTLNGWIQIAIYFVVLTALVVPLGRYMAQVFEGERTFLTPVLGPVERGLYRISGIDETREQHWITYTVAMLLFNAAGFALLYALLRLQAVLPLNPAGMSAVAPDLSFNTAVSFTSNTNWQNYGGESTLSYLTQMVGLTTRISFRLPPASPWPWCLSAPSREPQAKPSAIFGSISAAAPSMCCCRCPSSRRLFSCGRACRRTSAPMSTRPRSRAPSRP
jgi:hypothetical protein